MIVREKEKVSLLMFIIVNLLSFLFSKYKYIFDY